MWRALNLSDGAMASSGRTRGYWWAQKATWKRRRRELSDRSWESGRGMMWYSGGAGSSGPTLMMISTLWRLHGGNRLPGTQWCATYGRSPGYRERKNIRSQKHWSWRTYNRCTGDGHQTPQFEGPSARSARWRIWNGSSPSSARNCGAWPITHCLGKMMTGGRLGDWRRCSLYPRGARIESISLSVGSRCSPSWESCVSGRRYQCADEDLATMPCVLRALRIAGGYLQETSVPMRQCGRTGLQNMDRPVRRGPFSSAPRDWLGWRRGARGRLRGLSTTSTGGIAGVEAVLPCSSGWGYPSTPANGGAGGGPDMLQRTTCPPPPPPPDFIFTRECTPP